VVVAFINCFFSCFFINSSNYLLDHCVSNSRVLKSFFFFIFKFSCYSTPSINVLSHYSFYSVYKSTFPFTNFFIRSEKSLFSSSKSNTLLCLYHSCSRFRFWRTSQNSIFRTFNRWFSDSSICFFNDFSFKSSYCLILDISSLCCWLLFVRFCVLVPII